MAKIPETGQATIGDIAEEWEGPKDLAELSKKAPLYMSGTEQVGIDDFRGKFYGAPTEATGGTVTEDGEYRYHTFTANGIFEITKAADGPTVMDVDVLLVAAGGGTNSKSGGGGGGIVEEKFTSVVGSKTVAVGTGRSGAKGYQTTVTGLTSAEGGGTESTGGCGSGQVAGGSSSSSQLPTKAGKNGTQGGNGGAANAFYDSVQSKWYYSSGGSGGGGGKSNGGASYIEGAANVGGSKAGNGGAGKAAAINGVTYSGGGGGCPAYKTSAMGTGGAGGGGNGKADGGSNGTFYGGGAGGRDTGGNASGYQGIVIFRYRIAPVGSVRTIDSTQFIAPKVESQPDYNPETHKAELKIITDPAQETVGWTVVELTDEEKAAYLAAQGDEE
jgi:hypothetical protein